MPIFDKCVICGEDSPYTLDTHIDYRIGYIEGGGQGCFKPGGCKSKPATLDIPINKVNELPNDAELGEYVRKLYWNYISNHF